MITATSSASTKTEPTAAAVNDNTNETLNDGVVQALGNEYVSQSNVMSCHVYVSLTTSSLRLPGKVELSKL